MSDNVLTIADASKSLDAGELSSRSLTEQALQAIEDHNSTLNAFLHVDHDGAMEAAAAADERAKAGKRLGPLDGVPISIKDNIVTTGMPTTAGDKILKEFNSPYDATVVQKLKAAGAVILGKNNLDAWGHGSSTENSAYGPTKNPWDTERVPGGSSGGSAAAVAAGLGLGSVGTDTGGSVRQPSALSGVTGFKPTYGRLSRLGLIAMGSSLDCPGTLTRSAADAVIMSHVMSGRDDYDATSLPEEQILLTEIGDKPKPLSGKKIGIPAEYFGDGLDPDVETIVREALKVYVELGAELVDISLPHTKYGIAAYYIIMPAEVSSNLARFDGIRYGLSGIRHQASGISSADDLIRANRSAGLGPEAKRRIMMGTYVLSSGYYDAFYKRASQVRSIIRDEFAEAFRSVDLIAGPTSPTAAFRHGEKAEDPLQMYLSDVYTVSSNLAGIPAISIPCGFVSAGNSSEVEERSGKTSEVEEARLPVGLQLQGPQLGDDDVLYAAMAFQRETMYHLHDPQEGGQHA